MATENIFISTYVSPVGELILGEYQGELCLADWRYRKLRDSIDHRISNGLKAIFVQQESEILTKIKMQLDEYFASKRQHFDIPLRPVGTPFQLEVWKVLQKIPYGKTVTYLQLCRIIGNEKAIRAVASANGANALSIIIPCHRVIGVNYKLTGYAGGIEAKRKLLTLENPNWNGQLSLL